MVVCNSHLFHVVAYTKCKVEIKIRVSKGWLESWLNIENMSVWMVLHKLDTLSVDRVVYVYTTANLR